MLQTAFPGCVLIVTKNGIKLNEVVHIYRCLINVPGRGKPKQDSKVETTETTYNIETSTRIITVISRHDLMLVLLLRRRLSREDCNTSPFLLSSS